MNKKLIIFGVAVLLSAINEDALYPDIEASLTYNDFINGVDPVLEKIKNLEQKQHFRLSLKKAKQSTHHS